MFCLLFFCRGLGLSWFRWLGLAASGVFGGACRGRCFSCGHTLSGLGFRVEGLRFREVTWRVVS